MNKKDLIKRLHEVDIIYKEEVTLRSGETSNFYCDIKKAYGHPDILNALAQEIGKKLPPNTTCIAVSGYGGLPLGSVVSANFGKKFTAVRNSPKNHGREEMIDGFIPTKDDVVVILDDVLTTGSSIKESINALKGTGAKIDFAIVVVKRADAKLPIPHSYLFEIKELTPSS